MLFVYCISMWTHTVSKTNHISINNVFHPDKIAHVLCSAIATDKAISSKLRKICWLFPLLHDFGALAPVEFPMAIDTTIRNMGKNRLKSSVNGLYSHNINKSQQTRVHILWDVR